MKNKSMSQFLSLLQPQTLVVLDIDSTLVLTHKRNQAIVRNFANDQARELPDLCAGLVNAQCNAFEYGYYPVLDRLPVPLTGAQKELLQKYWRTQFFSNDHLHHDLVHDGALDFVELLHKKGIPHFYLTGRPKPLMWEGTLKTLNEFGFKVDAEKLFLKPQPAEIDEIFKSEKIKEWKNQFPQILFIDNEPKVLNQIDRDHPDVNLVFVDTCHSPNVVPPATAFKIKDFREVVQLFKRSSY